MPSTPGTRFISAHRGAPAAAAGDVGATSRTAAVQDGGSAVKLGVRAHGGVARPARTHRDVRLVRRRLRHRGDDARRRARGKDVLPRVDLPGIVRRDYGAESPPPIFLAWASDDELGDGIVLEKAQFGSARAFSGLSSVD